MHGSMPLPRIAIKLCSATDAKCWSHYAFLLTLTL